MAITLGNYLPTEQGRLYGGNARKMMKSLTTILDFSITFLQCTKVAYLIAFLGFFLRISVVENNVSYASQTQC